MSAAVGGHGAEDGAEATREVYSWGDPPDDSALPQPAAAPSDPSGGPLRRRAEAGVQRTSPPAATVAAGCEQVHHDRPPTPQRAQPAAAWPRKGLSSVLKALLSRAAGSGDERSTGGAANTGRRLSPVAGEAMRRCTEDLGPTSLLTRRAGGRPSADRAEAATEAPSSQPQLAQAMAMGELPTSSGPLARGAMRFR